MRHTALVTQDSRDLARNFPRMATRRAGRGMANGPDNQGGCLLCVLQNERTSIIGLHCSFWQFVELCIVNQVCSSL